jgi:ribonuclease HI
MLQRTMSVPAPHFLLFSETSRYSAERARRSRPQWRFVLESVEGDARLEAADEEPNVRGDRLDLLAVVRGLEALDQPSRVTLVTPSQYVSRGLRSGLDQWRETGWQWERFGEMTPITNGDLWRRVDRALHYHKVEVRTWRLDPAVGQDDSSISTALREPQVSGKSKVASNPPKQRTTSSRRWTQAAAVRLCDFASHLAARLRHLAPPQRQSVTA